MITHLYSAVMGSMQGEVKPMEKPKSNDPMPAAQENNSGGPSRGESAWLPRLDVSTVCKRRSVGRLPLS